MSFFISILFCAKVQFRSFKVSQFIKYLQYSFLVQNWPDERHLIPKQQSLFSFIHDSSDQRVEIRETGPSWRFAACYKYSNVIILIVWALGLRLAQTNKSIIYSSCQFCYKWNLIWSTSKLFFNYYLDENLKKIYIFQESVNLQNGRKMWKCHRYNHFIIKINVFDDVKTELNNIKTISGEQCAHVDAYSCLKTENICRYHRGNCQN